MIVDLTLAAILILIAVIDVTTLRIPDALSLPLMAMGLAWGAVESRLPVADHLGGAVGGFLLLAAFGEVYFRRRGREGLGLGDAKLFGAAGAWLGWQALPLVLVVASVGGLVQALIQRLAQGRSEIAFGPWIALGFWIAWWSPRL